MGAGAEFADACSAMPATTISDDVRERLALLREESLALLGVCTADWEAPYGPDLIVALQDVSNRLGAAQAALSPTAPLKLVPAPIESSPSAETDRTEPRTESVAPGPAAPFSAEAAIVLSLAEITVPFAHTPQDEAERWLRVMRQEGQVAAALRALGVDEAQLATLADAGPPADRANGLRAVGAVRDRAAMLARDRGGAVATTVDVLFAVMLVYGRDFDRSLYATGVSRVALLDRLSGRTGVTQTG